MLWELLRGVGHQHAIRATRRAGNCHPAQLLAAPSRCGANVVASRSIVSAHLFCSVWRGGHPMPHQPLAALVLKIMGTTRHKSVDVFADYDGHNA